MSKPVWLLDLDGVVNACPRLPDPPPACWPADQWIQAEVKNGHSDVAWPILAARPVLHFIAAVHAVGQAEVRWHSTWQEEANLVSDALGLPHFEAEPAPEYERWNKSARGWWKVPAVQRASARTGGNLIWTDDEAAYPKLERKDRLALRNAGVLIVAPSASMGLTQGNLDKITFYLTGNEELAA